MTARTLILAFYLFWASGAALAQDLPTAPRLRIEPGMHTAPITDAGIDQSRDLLVTGALDNTVRIWALPELRLVRVLRPPIGGESSVGAVALTSDGKIAAVGGWPGAGTGQYAVDLFDVATGQLIRQFTADEPVVALAFSQDGLRLAAGLSKTGLRVWRMADGAMEEDRDYQDQVQALDFCAGRLAVASSDGAVRLYAPTSEDAGSLNPQQRVATEVGQKPWKLAFSPDGRSLAIAFEDKPAVEVRSASDLTLEAKPDVNGLASDQGFYAVAWSLDSSTVLAGGDAFEAQASKYQVFAWAERGSGPRRVASSDSDQVISAIWMLRDPNSLVAADTGPAVNVFVDGSSKAKKQKPQVDFGYLSQDANEPGRNVFHVSDDGSVVETGYFDSPARPLRLDASALTITQLDAPTPGLTSWQPTESDLRAGHFVYDEHPELNGRPLGLKQPDIAYSVDVRHDRVLLGSQTAISLFDSSAHEAWSAPAAAAFRVAQSPDGRLVVAALGDGTVRWYRATDGVELLAFFLDADGKRWVAFTPSGYYAASPGGEDLVGWQVDKGPDQAPDFFPPSKFRDRFYRPDVVSLVLKTLDEAEALRQGEAAAAQHEASAPTPETAEQRHEQPAPTPEAATTQHEAPAPRQDTAEQRHEAPPPAPGAAAEKQAVLTEQPPAVQPDPAAALPVAGLPGLAPVRVVLNVARDDVGHARRAADIRQALAAAGLEVADHVPVDAQQRGPSIGYYFQSDRNAAAEVSHVLEPLLGALAPVAIRKRASIPEPGTIEIAIP